ncbi:MAG: gluconate 2-dehydrogenase subunit 3 family protein [Leucobacter sp.]
MTNELSDEQREALGVLAVTLIPQSDDGPSAREAGVTEIWIDVTLAERPDLAEQLRMTLDAYKPEEGARAYLDRLERDAPAEFAQLTYAIAASFFKSPVAQEWLGSGRILDEYEGAEPEPTAVTEELLRPVRAMPSFYRPTDFVGGNGDERN